MESTVKTARYQVGKQWWFPQLGRKPDAGEIIELPVDVAEKYMHNEPGLLKPAMKTTQATVPVTREKPTRAKRRVR